MLDPLHAITAREYWLTTEASSYSLVEIAELCGVKYQAVRMRVRKAFSKETGFDMFEKDAIVNLIKSKPIRRPMKRVKKGLHNIKSNV